MSGGEHRLLVLDEDLDPQLAEEIARRGRPATSVYELGLLHSKDPVLLPALRERLDSYVLVTADMAMPREWRDLLGETGTTVAIVSSGGFEGPLLECRRRDIVHRWAHAMQLQEDATCRTYEPSTSAPWRPRTRSTVPRAPGYKVPRLR